MLGALRSWTPRSCAFSRDGFHCTTMQDIVPESGLSPGAIYNYFKSKEGLSRLRQSPASKRAAACNGSYF
jgi:hypothetical protein